MDTIAFNIPGAGVQTITPTSVLPFITAPVTIDGTTQTGASCTAIGGLKIELNSASAGFVVGGFSGGLQLESGASGSTIRGLIINRFGEGGIVINNSNSNFVQCNYIGTDVAGTAVFGNFLGILITNGNGNTIGGTNAGDRNVISGNSTEGISLSGNNTQIQGNYIGINAGGTAALRNGAFGIAVRNSTNTIIGGATAAARNVISGNNDGGLLLSSPILPAQSSEEITSAQTPPERARSETASAWISMLT